MVKGMQAIQASDKEEAWHIYIVECSDQTYYTGITNDLERRLAQHNSGKGARYTRTRRPIILRYYETVQSRSAALMREIEIKKLQKPKKLELISKSHL